MVGHQRVTRSPVVRGGFAIGPAGRSENDELAARLRSRSSDARSALTWIPRREPNQRNGHDQSSPHSFHWCSSPNNGFTIDRLRIQQILSPGLTEAIEKSALHTKTKPPRRQGRQGTLCFPLAPLAVSSLCAKRRYGLSSRQTEDQSTRYRLQVLMPADPARAAEAMPFTGNSRSDNVGS